MSAARWFSGILGVILVAYGVACMLNPALLMAPVGLTGKAAAQVEIRAMYGGVQIGFGLYCLLAARSAQRTGHALVVIASIFLSIAICRGLGMLLSQTGGAFHSAALCFEVVVGITSVWLWRAQTPAKKAPLKVPA